MRERGVNFAYVTLHVGAGTFQPVRVNDLAQHRMHRERYWIPQATVDAVAATRARGGRVIAVGTTSLRALEGAAQAHGGTLTAAEGETEIFILPGFDFRRRRLPDHQLPPAEVDTADAGLGLRRLRHHAARLCACGSAALPLLQLW